MAESGGDRKQGERQRKYVGGRDDGGETERAEPKCEIMKCGMTVKWPTSVSAESV